MLIKHKLHSTQRIIAIRDYGNGSQTIDTVFLKHNS
tara:strand:- start:400 stop:507 length:108 start_codon:yes stop_codon:yes gene_type:complete